MEHSIAEERDNSASMKPYFSNLPFSFKSALVGTAVAIFLVTLQSKKWMSPEMKGPTHHWDLNFVVFPILNYSVWLLLLPLLYMLMRWVYDAYGKDGILLKRNGFFLAAAIAFTVAHEFIAVIFYNIVYFAFHWEAYASESVMFDITAGVMGLTQSFLEFWLIFFLIIGFHSRQRARKFKLRNAQLESDLLKAQMSALKNQLHPHFLFNSFNTISSLMEENIDLAQRMITKLGALLRKILREGDKQFIEIREEVELAKLYLEVEQIRFKGRLVTKFAIEDSLNDLVVPSLIIQPLVENAIKHGFYKKTGACEISIKIYEEAECIVIRVLDNGGGVKNDQEFSFGIGLKNTEARLERSYGQNYELNVDPHPPEGGFCIEIKVLKSCLNHENNSSNS